MTDHDVVIVGAGHGGAQAAAALRHAKFAGTIAIVGDEPELPYERPPLSKEYLSRDKSFDRILIRHETFWHNRAIAMLTGRRVTAVAPATHTITIDDGDAIGYGKLIWATGGTARRLSCAGHDFAGVDAVRTRADVDRLTRELAATEQVVVIGGGYIGLEAAAVLANFGKQVTVLEALDRVLARVAGPELSRFYEAEHRARGVDVRLSAQVDCIVGDAGCVSGVGMADGSVIPCEMVIVGIGVIPAVAPLIDVGAEGANGVLVDAACRTSFPDVYAIGDCALHANAFADGALIRLESVQNANNQAAVAAKAIAGISSEYHVVRWFWSNQYDLRLQTIGLSIGHDDAVLRGTPAKRSFSIIYLKKGRVIALDCADATKDYAQGRALVTGRAKPDRAQLADGTAALRTLV